MDKGDFRFRYALLDELRPNFVVDVEPARLWVEMSQNTSWVRFVSLVSFQIRWMVAMACASLPPGFAAGVDRDPHIRGRLAPIPGDLEHIVVSWINRPPRQSSARLTSVSVNSLSSGEDGATTTVARPFFSSGRGSFEHVGCLDIREGVEYRKQLREIINLAKRVFIRKPEPSGASSRPVTASAKFAAQASKCSILRSASMSRAR